MPTLIYACLVSLLPAIAIAHVQQAASRFSGEWLLTGLLIVVAALYARGFLRLWHKSAAGKHSLRRQGLLFSAGWMVMALSLLSPLHRLGARSFTAHMIEHELLMLVATPLMALSKPLGILLWGFRSPIRQVLAGMGKTSSFTAFWNVISSPLSASLIQATMLWVWHSPMLFDRALQSEGWHAAQHLSLVFSALLFWWSMNRTAATLQRPGVAVFFLFFTSIQSGFLGALMAFANSPWYTRYAAMGMSGTGNLTPLEDQQVAGLIMWIPGGAVHALAAFFYLGLWFHQLRRAQRSPQVSPTV